MLSFQCWGPTVTPTLAPLPSHFSKRFHNWLETLACNQQPLAKDSNPRLKVKQLLSKLLPKDFSKQHDRCQFGGICITLESNLLLNLWCIALWCQLMECEISFLKPFWFCVYMYVGVQEGKNNVFGFSTFVIMFVFIARMKEVLVIRWPLSKSGFPLSKYGFPACVGKNKLNGRIFFKHYWN